MTPSRPVTTAAQRLLLVALSSALGFGGLEVWASLSERDRLRIPHPTRHHALKPLTDSEEGVWGLNRYYMAVNSLGMRDAQPRQVPLREPGATRVLFLGDSFTEGVGVGHEHTFVHQVEQRLKDQPARVRCLNAGVASYSPLVELVTLQELLTSGLQIDAVVLMLDVSDPQDEVLYQTYLGDTYDALLAEQSGSPPSFHSWWFRGIYERSALFRRYAFKLATSALERRLGGLWRDGYQEDREKWVTDPELQERWAERGLTLAFEHLRLVAEMCRQRDLPFLLVVYPWPQLLTADASFYEARVRRFTDEHHAELLDLFPDFRSASRPAELFVSGDVHWTPRGHALVASALAQRLAEWLGTGRLQRGPQGAPR